VLNADLESIRARRRDDLAASLEWSEQHLEDVEGEVRRFGQARNAIVRPQGLGLGLGILGYFAVVGIVVPTWIMSRGPVALTPRMGARVFTGFLSGLVALLSYMALIALRLSRRAATASLAQQGRQIGRRLLAACGHGAGRPGGVAAASSLMASHPVCDCPIRQPAATC
jgi:hypothetical protein